MWLPMLAGQLPTWYLLSDNCRKKPWNNKGLYIVFMDFSKAFDTVDRWTHWKVLKAYGCPELFINMIRQFHDSMTGRVSIGGDINDAFPINIGVKQGCVLAPKLYTLYLGAVLETMSTNLASGIYIWTHSDGKLFNLACLKVETRTNTLCVRELLFADDTVLVATDYNDIQEIMDQFHSAANMFGLKINTKNGIDVPTTPHWQPSSREHRCVNKWWGLEVYRQLYISGKCSDQHQLIQSSD